MGDGDEAQNGRMLSGTIRGVGYIREGRPNAKGMDGLLEAKSGAADG
jgi:hypothetical protein